MENKGQAAMDFLMTYGWAILVVLILIGALSYFVVLNKNELLSEEIKLDNRAYNVCNNLDIDGFIYPTIITIRNSLSGGPIAITDIFGSKAYEHTWTESGVNCRLPADMCDVERFYCFKTELVIPVNFTEYDQWKEDVQKSGVQ